MQTLIAKILTYIFVLIIYLFIYAIVRMIYLDIRVMSSKKAGLSDDAYLKLVNLRSALDFEVEESYALSDDQIIGRGEDCDITIGDSFMSSRHCRIYREDGSFYVDDLDSTNGTVLNGEKLAGEVVELMDGDKLSIGRVVFLFVKPMPKEEASQ